MGFRGSAHGSNPELLTSALVISVNFDADVRFTPESGHSVSAWYVRGKRAEK